MMKKHYVCSVGVIEAMLVLAAAGFLGGIGSVAQAANTVTIGTTAPTTDIIESYEPTVLTTAYAIRRLGPAATPNITRANAQTFEHETAFTITAVTFKSSAATSYDTLTPHVIMMAVVEDTNGDNTPDTQLGSDQFFDMAGKSVAIGDFYTFTLGTPTAVLQADRRYSVAFWWTTDDTQHNLLMVKATTAFDEYTKGGAISNYNRDWPPTEAPSAAGDYQFYIQGAIASGPEAEVKDGAATIANGGGPVDFGSAAVGAPALSKTFTVNNLGTADLTTSNLTVPTGYSITGALSATISAGGSATFTVELPTTAAGVFSGDISFANNDSDENPY
ncbi:MAG: choice-of-anchor D domain-containing protein, partial [Candidatus Sumerlaeota bacterium]|nr:choice-of-anchor D domain-containing protein [Candidatus Sumerlaeota bacterium]